MATHARSPFFYALIPAASYAVIIALFVIFAPRTALRWAPLLSTLAILVSTVSAFIAAIVTGNRAASAQREVARVKATYDNIAAKLWDKDYINARNTLIKALGENKVLKDFVVGTNPKYQEERDLSAALMNIANDYELTAIAMENDIIDEKFYKSWFRQSYINDYNRLDEYIRETRRLNRNEKIFIKFQTLAEKWQAEGETTAQPPNPEAARKA